MPNTSFLPSLDQTAHLDGLRDANGFALPHRRAFTKMLTGLMPGSALISAAAP